MAKQPKRPELTRAKVTSTTHPKAPWRVTYDSERDGKPVRLRKTFAQEEAAWAFAVLKEVEISNHGIRFGDIPAEVRRAYDYFRDQSAELAEIGAEVPRFEDLISTALAEIRTKHNQAEENQIPVAEVVEEFLAYKKTRVKSLQLSNLTNQLKRFALDYGTTPIAGITTRQIEKWLSSLRSLRNPDKLAKAPFLSPLSRNHHRATLHSLFKYASAKTRAWCQHNPVADIEAEQVSTSEPKAYSPEDAAKIMQAALDHKPELLPILALGFFGGLRVSEAEVFDLSQITPDTEEFRVNSVKTGERLVPLNNACRAWLFAQSRRKGKALVGSERKKDDDVAEVIRLAGVKQINNGARHSFISYRTAEIRDVARVADEVGNSVGMIKKHYRKVVTTAAAVKFFAIMPKSTKGKIVKFSA